MSGDSLLRFTTVWAGLTLMVASVAHPTTFYVSPSGSDGSSSSGTSPAQAWKTVERACARADTGDTIRLLAGTWVQTATATLKSGMAVVGTDTASTRILGSRTWQLNGRRPRDVDNNRGNYLFAIPPKSRGISISGISFASQDTTRRLNGAIWCSRSSNIEISNCFFTEFAWNGVCLIITDSARVHHNRFFNACQEKDGFTSGQIVTKWLKNGDIHHNTIMRTKGAAYGYKSQLAGHRKAKIHHNRIAGHYFSIESAHDHEYGLEIYENELGGCISLPKHEGGVTELPEGVDYAVWIHHNIMHDSYGVEGPRNFLRISHNYIDITKTNGRVYTQHQSSVCRGPVWFHHNVVVNVDRGLVWAHGAGTLNNVQIYHNTVYCADAGSRTGSILGIPGTAENWTFHNNIVVAPDGRPRELYGDAQRGAQVVTATHNVFVNINNVPDGNWRDTDPGLALSGRKPDRYYAPAGGESFVVDRGKDLGSTFAGSAPDPGAYEFAAGPQPTRLSPRSDVTTSVGSANGTGRLILHSAGRWDACGRWVSSSDWRPAAPMIGYRQPRESERRRCGRQSGGRDQ